MNLRDRIAFDNINIAFRNIARAITENFVPAWKAFSKAIDAAYEAAQRNKLYCVLPDWIPHSVKIWIVGRWPRRFLPKVVTRATEVENEKG